MDDTCAKGRFQLKLFALSAHLILVAVFSAALILA